MDLDELATGTEQLTAKDAYTLSLWQEHGLGNHPTIIEIEPVATRLLENVHMILDAAAMVLGRYVNAEEKDIFGPVLIAQTGKKRYGVLLMLRAIEQIAEAKK